MSALVKLHCSDKGGDEGPLRAGPVDQIKFVWPDRGDAANGRSEPIAEVSNFRCMRAQHGLCCIYEGQNVMICRKKRPLLLFEVEISRPSILSEVLFA